MMPHGHAVPWPEPVEQTRPPGGARAGVGLRERSGGLRCGPRAAAPHGSDYGA